MKIVDRFKSTDELYLFRDHLNSLINEKIGSPLEEQDLDDFLSKLVGARDISAALEMVREANKELSFKIRATIKSGDSNHAIVFDAELFFESSIRGGLVEPLCQIFLQGHIGSHAVEHIAQESYRDDLVVRKIVDYCRKEKCGITVSLNMEDLRNWLSHKGFIILSIWVDAFLEKKTIQEFCKEKSGVRTLLESVENYADEFHSHREYEFLHKRELWGWVHTYRTSPWGGGYESRKSQISFESQGAAFANFLDYYLVNHQLD